jgi:hypothetical protein
MNETPLLSRREIAAKIQRSPTAVNNALRRLQIKPTFTTGKFEYFQETIISKLDESMRRRNYQQRNNS